MLQYVTKNIIDKMLKHSRGITKPEGHDQIFRMPASGLKSHFSFILFLYLEPDYRPHASLKEKTLASQNHSKTCSSVGQWLAVADSYPI